MTRWALVYKSRTPVDSSDLNHITTTSVVFTHHLLYNLNRRSHPRYLQQPCTSLVLFSSTSISHHVRFHKTILSHCLRGNSLPPIRDRLGASHFRHIHRGSYCRHFKADPTQVAWISKSLLRAQNSPWNPPRALPLPRCDVLPGIRNTDWPSFADSRQ